MYAVIVELKIKPGAMDAFMPLMRANAARSLRDEPGCVQFDICVAEGVPDTVLLYELYNDRADFDAHLASAHFKQFDAAVADLLADKRVVTALRHAPGG